MSNFSAIGIVILAAGASTRLGTPKQLLPYRGQSLLRHTAEVALASGYQLIVVVLGAQVERLEAEVQQLPVYVVGRRNFVNADGTTQQVNVPNLEVYNPEF